MSRLADLPELVGFFSYSREDDEDSNGALSALRDRIARELRAQLGRSRETFRLWQDKESIPSGALWEAEIRNAIAESVFFIPIVTPTLVKSRYCQFELEAFLVREAALGKSDLIFPILYIRVPALEDSSQASNHPALSILTQRQLFDWRTFRHRDVSSMEVREAIGQFCAHICDELNRPWASPEERQARDVSQTKRAEAEQRRHAEADRREQTAAREAPRSFISYASTRPVELNELARLRANAGAAPAGLELLSAGVSAAAGAGRMLKTLDEILAGEVITPAEKELLPQTENTDSLRARIAEDRRRAQARRREEEARRREEQEQPAAMSQAAAERSILRSEASPMTTSAPRAASRKPWGLVIAFGVVAVGAWMLRRQIADLAHALFGWFGLSSLPPIYVATTPPPSQSAPENSISDTVDISAFAPLEAAAGEEALVQIYLHRFDQAQLAATRAQRADPDASERDKATLATNITRGQTVDVILEAQGLTIEEPRESIVWRGGPEACKFVVFIPVGAAGRSFAFRVRVLLDSAPIGKLVFKLKVAAAQPAHGTTASEASPSYGFMSSPDTGRPDAAMAMVGDAAKRYRHAFLSYTEADRAEVLRGAQLLRAAGLSIFQDIVSAVPGERWEPKIFQEIDKCDLFLLFWSHAAAASEWVLREAEYAIARQQKNLPDEVPDIRPVVLCDPPIPEPPEPLRHINFNDHVCYLITAVKAVERRPHS
jgi:hypothetical protein